MGRSYWKSSTLVFIISFLALHSFVNTSEYAAFEVDENRIKYHANWTSSQQQLDNVEELQKAYEVNGIKQLDLSLSMSTLHLETIKKLLPTRFQQYRSIKINLGSNPIGTEGADYVLSLIPNGIEQLQIGFDSINADLNLGEVIAKRLNNLDSLKRLKVSLILAVKNDSTVDGYLRQSKLGDKLESYTLVLIGNSLTSVSLGSLQAHLSTISLKQLDLNLYANDIGPEGARLVSEALQTQKNLDWLSVDVYFNNITEVGTKHLCDGIEAIKHDGLKYLNLNLDFNYINNEGGKAVGALMSKLTSVQSLQLGVASKNFGYIGFKHIVNGLGHLGQLKELEFRCGINRVGGNGAQITRDLIYKLPNLVSLNLNFYENYVGDDGLIELTKAINSLEHLKTLNLDFGFNDAKGYALLRTLENIAKKTYNELSISFSSNQFQDTEVNLVKDRLVNIIEKTKYFSLDFMETAISKSMKTQLEELFAKHAQSSGNDASIRVNSVISEEQQAKYDSNSEERQRILKKIDAEKKAKEEQEEAKKAAKAKPASSAEPVAAEPVKTATETPEAPKVVEEVKVTETEL